MTRTSERAKRLLADAAFNGATHYKRLADADYRWIRRHGFARGLYSFPADEPGLSMCYFTLTPAGQALLSDQVPA